MLIKKPKHNIWDTVYYHKTWANIIATCIITGINMRSKMGNKISNHRNFNSYTYDISEIDTRFTSTILCWFISKDRNDIVKTVAKIHQRKIDMLQKEIDGLHCI